MFSPGLYLRNFHTGIHCIWDGRLQYTGQFEALSSAQDQSCVDRDCAVYEVTLNAAALSSRTSLLVQLSSSLHIPLPVTLLFLALVDSSSSHCFINQKFADDNKIPCTTISPVTLRLLDGSSPGNIT